MIAISTLSSEQGERTRALGAFALSVLLNLIALVLIAWWSVSSPTRTGASAPLDARSPLIVPEEHEKDDELRLGKRDTSSASINWLGIDAPEEILAPAPESEVDQAAQSTAPGDSAIPTDSAPTIEQAPSEAAPAQPTTTPDPIPVQTPPIPTPEPEPIEQPQTPPPSSQPEPTPTDPAPITDPGTDDTTQVEDDTLPEITSDIGIVIQDEIDGDSDDTTNAPSSTPDSETPEPTPDPAPQPSTNPSPQSSPNTPSNTSSNSIAALPSLRGVVSDRDVIATAIKRAEKLDPDRAHQPIVGEGLEIKTVLSTGLLSSEARLYGAGANPVIVLEFNAQGKVAHAQYLRSFDREYNTGSRLLNEQLLNMLYKWKASGARIDALNPRDPHDTVQITIKILFRPETKQP